MLEELEIGLDDPDSGVGIDLLERSLDGGGECRVEVICGRSWQGSLHFLPTGGAHGGERCGIDVVAAGVGDDLGDGVAVVMDSG